MKPIRFAHWPLGRKLLALVLAAATLPLGACVVVLLVEARARVREGAGHLLGARADELGAEMDAFLRRYRQLALFLGRVGVERLQVGAEQNRAALPNAFDSTSAALVSSMPELRAATLIDKSGVIVASSDPVGVGTNVFRRAYFQEALAGHNVVSDVFMPMSGGAEPLIAFTAPIYGQGSLRIGVAAVYVRVDAFWRLVHESRDRAGPGSHAMVYDGKGVRIATARDREGLRFRPAGDLPQAEREAMIAEQRFGPATATLLGAPVVAAQEFALSRQAEFSPAGGLIRRSYSDTEQRWNLILGRRLAEAPWTVFVLVPEGAVFAPLLQLLGRGLTVSALILILGLLGAVLVARAILRPLQAFTAATERLGGGDLSARVLLDARDGHDEIGRLADRFNEMATALAAGRAELEDRVRARTMALENANTEAVEQRAALIEQRALMETQQLVLQEKSAEASRADRLKSEFLANISHELRTPLNSIIGFSELLLHEGGQEGKHQFAAHQRKYLDDVLASGKHLLAVINDILDLSKIEAGHITLELEALSPGDVIGEACQVLQPAATRREVTLLTPPCRGASVRADRAKLLQVLLNLLSNAIKFSAIGARVTVTAQDDGDFVRFNVDDEGPGISPSLRARLFQPFVQGEDPWVKRHQGTGLGLVICKRLVEQQGGNMGVDAHGSGSRFWFRLPVAKLVALPAAEVDVLPSAARLLTVLVVDDHDLNRELVRSLLERRGQTVLQACDGEEGVSLARSHRPDIVLMDLAMPNKDGLCATRELRADPETRMIPIVALTALAMRGDEERARAAGVDEYLTKPVDRKRLEETIDRLTAKRRVAS